jgi:hypothetical protein
MVHVRMALAADYVNETADGKLNVLGIFDSINSRSFPAVHRELRLIVSLEFTLAECATERELKIDFIDQDGKSVVTMAQSFSVPRPDAGSSSSVVIYNKIVHLKGLPLPHEGLFEFHVLLDNNDIARIPIHAKLTPAPPEPRGAS